AWRSLMKRGSFWNLLIMYHCYCWGAFFYLGWMPTYLQKGRGFTEDEMKFWAALPFAFGAMGTLTGGALSDWLVKTRGHRFGRVVVGTAGLTLGSVFLFATALTGDKITAAICLGFGYFSIDCFLPVSWAVALDLGRRSSGALSGAMNMAGQVGSFISTVAVGYLVESIGYHNALL